MAVGDIIKVRFLATRGSQLGQNIRHYRISTEVTGGATYQEIADNINTTASPLYRELLSSAATFQGVAVQKIQPLPMLLEFMSTGTPGAGLRSGDPLPGQCSGIITLRTSLAGRAFRGRAYVPFPAEMSCDEGSQTTALYFGDLQDLGGFLVTGVTVVGATGTTTLVPGIHRRGTSQIQDLVGFTARNVFATQRRRGSYGRPDVIPPA